MKGKFAPGLRFTGASAIATAAALMAFVVSPGATLADSNETNTKTVNQARLESRGTETASGGGVAVSGPAITFDKAIVQQKNIQVVAGGPDAQANATQTATNDATINQTTAAVTGDATATDGGSASSGAAVAGSVAIVHQMNIQIIACPHGTEPIEQTASNAAEIDQTTVAVTGDATADGGGSSATSGSAFALERAIVRQRNLQLYVCRGGGGGSGSQTASNTAGVGQTGIALTGDAGASDGGDAGSGDAETRGTARTTQSNRQIARD